MSQVAEAQPVTTGGPGELQLQLHRAAPGDVKRLAAFSSAADALSAEQLSDCIEFGGVVYYEDEAGPLALLCWREAAGGWELSPVIMRGGQAGTPHDRWLLTHVEALAIRHNVPFLMMQLTDPTDLGYWRRLGYEPEYPGASRLVRRVGGTWQLRQAAA